MRLLIAARVVGRQNKSKVPLWEDYFVIFPASYHDAMATSVLSRGSVSLDAWIRRSAPKVEINLSGQKPGFVSSYTTGDQIDGTAIITVDHGMRFDEIEIVLQGTLSDARFSIFGR